MGRWIGGASAGGGRQGGGLSDGARIEIAAQGGDVVIRRADAGPTLAALFCGKTAEGMEGRVCRGV